MTLVFGSGDLQNVQLGLNEIASAVSISKTCGSVFTRREDASLFDIFEAKFDIRITKVPIWLRTITFGRSGFALGEKMRTIRISDVMKDVDMSKLSGIATFVVLCAKFVEDKPNIIRLLEKLLAGDLGKIVQAEVEIKLGGIPYSFKPHVEKFISSCLDADRDSDQSNCQRDWMARLAEYGSFGWRAKDFSIRRFQATINLISELFGEESMEENMAKLDPVYAEKRKNNGISGWAHIHDTLHLTGAYLALAAAANGASVVVQCMTSGNSQYFPKEPPITDRSSTFLVRLWICQPPESVCSVLRYMSGNETIAGTSGESGGLTRQTDDVVTIFGGSLEVAIWIARGIKYTPTLEGEMRETLLQLWAAGVEIARELHWSSRWDQEHGEPRLRLRFHDEPTFSSEIVRLSKALQTGEPALRNISRHLAKSLHDLYRLNDYENLCNSGSTGRKGRSDEIIRARDFLLTVISIETIRNLVYSRDSRLDQYALSLASITGSQSLLRNLTSQTLSDGSRPCDLLWGASAIWGGASEQSQGLSRVDDTVVGVVAPYCTVILDMIREPLLFATKGTKGKLISIWHGAVPMLPRHPTTGFCKSPIQEANQLTDLREGFRPTEVHPSTRLDEQMSITFEPMLGDAAFGIFCCWYSGSLAAELQPHVVFRNLLKNNMEDFYGVSWPGEDVSMVARRVHPPFLRIGRGELLEVKRFRTLDDIITIVSGLEDPSWKIYAAGCCLDPDTYVYYGSEEALDMKKIQESLKEQAVIMVVPRTNS